MSFQIGVTSFPRWRSMPKFLYQEDLSKMLHDKPLSTLRYWRHIGYGPKSFKIGGRVVYKLEDVEQWIEAQYNNSDSAAQTAGRAAG